MMLAKEFILNVILVLICYGYIFLIILISTKMHVSLHISRKNSRKFLHMMIGNLPFIIPLFTHYIFPTVVAAPFILVTFLASSYSPVRAFRRKLKGISELTSEGHEMGLFFYAVSYTFLAFFLAQKPYTLAAGILPMAYGDAVASIVGEKYGKMKYRLIAEKSLEGSTAMFIVSFVLLWLSLLFFSMFYPLSLSGTITSVMVVAAVTTLVEGLSPLGFDNLTVPVFGALAFLVSTRGA